MSGYRLSLFQKWILRSFDIATSAISISQWKKVDSVISLSGLSFKIQKAVTCYTIYQRRFTQNIPVNVLDLFISAVPWLSQTIFMNKIVSLFPLSLSHPSLHRTVIPSLSSGIKDICILNLSVSLSRLDVNPLLCLIPTEKHQGQMH